MTASTNTTYDSPLSPEQIALFRVYMERAYRAMMGASEPAVALNPRGEGDSNG